MAKHLLVFPRAGHLIPADPWSLEQIDKLEADKTYGIDLVNTRKLGSLNHWWAGLAYMVERWEGEGDNRAKLYATSRKLNDAVLVYLGFSETWYHLDGSVHVRADSIRFEAIKDEDEFKAIFEKARVMALELWGIDPWTEWQDAKQRENDMKQRRWG